MKTVTASAAARASASIACRLLMRSQGRCGTFVATRMNAGTIVRPVSALARNLAYHGGQYASDAPYSTTLAAPIVAPTAGAISAAQATNTARARMLSSRGGPSEKRLNSRAAVSARATFATSANSTHDRLQRGHAVTR